MTPYYDCGGFPFCNHHLLFIAREWEEVEEGEREREREREKERERERQTDRQRGEREQRIR